MNQYTAKILQRSQNKKNQSWDKDQAISNEIDADNAAGSASPAASAAASCDAILLIV